MTAHFLGMSLCLTGMFVTWFAAPVINTAYTRGKNESSPNVCESFTQIHSMEQASYLGLTLILLHVSFDHQEATQWNRFTA